MKIKDVEKRTGITSYNIRFYEKENLLIPKRNPVNGYREYTEEDILLLNRIKMLRMLDIPVSDIRKILYEKEALTSVLNTHLLKIKEEENRLRQNYFLCEELIKLDMSVTDLSEEMLDKMISGKEEYIYQLERIKRQDRIQKIFDISKLLPLRCIYKKNREARDMYVNVENVNFAYDKKPILHDINFGMNKGEITGLIGPNGAGKSTMLKLMIKKMKPNNGKIIIGDNDIFSIKRENNPVTFIPDIPVYYEELTVWEHLQFIKALYPENSVTVDSLIREFNLNQHLNKIPSALSKGTLQKLMIALALLRQYDVLLADEPFNGLDPAQTYKFKNTLKNLKKQDKTILISTHLLSLAEDFCDRYIFLYDGRIVEQGTKAEILQKQQMNKETSLEQIYMSLIGEGEHYAGVQKTVMCE